MALLLRDIYPILFFYSLASIVSHSHLALTLLLFDLSFLRKRDSQSFLRYGTMQWSTIPFYMLQSPKSLRDKQKPDTTYHLVKEDDTPSFVDISFAFFFLFKLFQSDSIELNSEICYSRDTVA